MTSESLDEFESLKARGESLLQGGRLKDALELYLEAVGQFTARGAHPIAAAACKRVLQIDPLCTKAHLMLSDAYEAMGQTQDSLYHLREVESFVRRSGDQGAVSDIQQRLRAMKEKASQKAKAKPHSMEAMLSCQTS